jgi:geranylgeranyl diphosphate synthase, type III
MEKALMKPYKCWLPNPGNNIRTQLIGCFNDWLRVADNELSVIKNVIKMVLSCIFLYMIWPHNRVDGVEDGPIFRRGLPVAHSVLGVPQTNSANYIYFRALRQLEELNNTDASKIFCGKIDVFMQTNLDEMINFHRGQGMDLFWRDNLVCPSTEEYIQMVNDKTSSLLRLAIRLMQACSSFKAYLAQT